MEEYSPLLWMVAIIGFMLLSSLSKVRKKAEKAMKRFEEHLPQEAWPTWAPEEESMSQRAERAAAASSVPAGERPAPTESEAEEYLVDTPESAVRHRPLRAATAPETGERLAGATEAEHAPDSGLTDGIAADFDLRKAVIYSEILKPKYDE